MKLGEISRPNGANKKRKRVGCGPGSGHGKTSCRGHKGQKARSGVSIPAWFEGGQMPLQRRLPKRGFTNIFKKEYQLVNLRDLQRLPADAEVNVETLRKARVISKRNLPVKLLGQGEIDRPVKISVHACTKSAKERVEKAGGQVEIIKIKTVND